MNYKIHAVTVHGNSPALTAGPAAWQKGHNWYAHVTKHPNGTLPTNLLQGTIPYYTIPYLSEEAHINQGFFV